MELESDDLYSARGLRRKWLFRIMLLVFSVACFIGFVNSFYDHYQLSHGIPGTIERASNYTAAPTSWSAYEGRLRAGFDVKVHVPDGTAFITTLYLAKEVVESLMRGEKAEIVFVKDRPGRHLVKGDPLPSIEWGWVLGGCIFMGVFVLSLRLR